MTCAICLEEIKDKDIKEILCGHKFHKDCIKESFKYERKCPLCRSCFLEGFLTYPHQEKIILTPSKEYSNFINNQLVSFKYLLKPSLVCWLERGSNYYPVYHIITTKNNSYKISSYLRNILLFSKFQENSIENYIDKNKKIFYCSNQDLNYKFKKKYFTTVEAWIYEVLKDITTKYNIFFHGYFNTIVNDLFFRFICRNDTSPKEYQTVIASALFISMEIYNKKINKIPLFKIKKNLIWLCAGGIIENKFEKIIREQKLKDKKDFLEFL